MWTATGLVWIGVWEAGPKEEAGPKDAAWATGQDRGLDKGHQDRISPFLVMDHSNSQKKAISYMHMYKNLPCPGQLLRSDNTIIGT